MVSFVKMASPSEVAPQRWEIWQHCQDLHQVCFSDIFMTCYNRKNVEMDSDLYPTYVPTCGPRCEQYCSKSSIDYVFVWTLFTLCILTVLSVAIVCYYIHRRVIPHITSLSWCRLFSVVYNCCVASTKRCMNCLIVSFSYLFYMFTKRCMKCATVSFSYLFLIAEYFNACMCFIIVHFNDILEPILLCILFTQVAFHLGWLSTTFIKGLIWLGQLCFTVYMLWSLCGIVFCLFQIWQILRKA